GHQARGVRAQAGAGLAAGALHLQAGVGEHGAAQLLQRLVAFAAAGGGVGVVGAGGGHGAFGHGFSALLGMGPQPGLEDGHEHGEGDRQHHHQLGTALLPLPTVHLVMPKSMLLAASVKVSVRIGPTTAVMATTMVMPMTISVVCEPRSPPAARRAAISEVSR